MTEFNNTWRKRLACQRCRQLKVRCEYSSPTNDTCIRCEKTGTPCIIPLPKRKDGKDMEEIGAQSSHSSENMVISPGKASTEEGKEEHAVYLRRIIRDAELKLKEMNISPLRQAISAGLYTVQEAADCLYALLNIPNAFPAFRLLNLPTNIMELDKSWPWLSISIVTAMSMNFGHKSIGEMQLYIQDLYRNTVNGPSHLVSLDRQLGYALMCQYALSFHERGLNALLQFHAITVSTIKELHRLGQYKLEQVASHTAVVTLLPYNLVRPFSAIGQICYYYSPFVTLQHGDDTMMPELRLNIDTTDGVESLSTTHVLAAGPLLEMIDTYNRASKDLVSASTLEDITRIIDVAIQSIELMANHTLAINYEWAKLHNPEYVANLSIPNSENLLMSPSSGTYLFAKMRLLKKAALRVLDLRVCSDEKQIRDLLHNIISQTAEYGGRLFRSFAHINSSKPFARTTVFYHVPDALLIMQMMRFIAFACGIDSDVRSDCLLEVVTMKWEEMMTSSIMVRQLFVLLFDPLDTANVKIGVYDQKTNSVIGSGMIPNFNLLYFDGGSRTIRETIPFTRQELLDRIEEESHKNELGTASPNWSENVETPSLSTVLHLLIHKL